jgi:hypothetical protein
MLPEPHATICRRTCFRLLYRSPKASASARSSGGGREVGGLERRWTTARACGQRKNDSAAPARHPHRRVQAPPMMGVLRDQMRDPSPLRRHTALKWRAVRQKRQLRVFLETTRHVVGVVTISADERIRIDVGEPCGFPAAPEPSEHFYHTKCSVWWDSPRRTFSVVWLGRGLRRMPCPELTPLGRTSGEAFGLP